MRSCEYRPYVEITHRGGYDLVVNKRQSTLSRDDMAMLTTSLWKSNNGSTNLHPLNTWHDIDGEGRFFVDNQQFPNFFAKVKWANRNYGVFRRALAIDPSTAPEYAVLQKRQMFAGNSILNEMSNSTTVREIVSTAKVQEIFKEFGPIEFAEPLIGLVERETQYKIMIYKHLKVERPPFPCERSFDTAVERLTQAFLGEGIIPDDLSSEQIVYGKNDSGDGRLYLLDIEFFRKAR